MLISSLFSPTTLNEDFAAWNTGEWVHYTNHDMLTIKPAHGHQDPSGIYLFPQNFDPNTYWKSMKNIFYVTLKDNSKILDYGELDEEEVHDLVYHVGGYADFEEKLKLYPPESKVRMLKNAWESMKFVMMMKPALWNKKVRDLGYDAIFDDTGSIHSSETSQLVVLNPSIIEKVRMVTRKDSGFEGMTKVVKDLENLCSRFGTVTVTPPKSKINRWNEVKTLVADVSVSVSENNYANFEITYDPSTTQKNIYVSLRYSQPRLGYGSGVEYGTISKKYVHSDITKLLVDLEKIFKSEKVAA